MYPPTIFPCEQSASNHQLNEHQRRRHLIRHPPLEQPQPQEREQPGVPDQPPPKPVRSHHPQTPEQLEEYRQREQAYRAYQEKHGGN